MKTGYKMNRNLKHTQENYKKREPRNQTQHTPNISRNPHIQQIKKETIYER